MSQIINLNTFATSHEAAISWINQQLISLGLIVKPSFDLKTAKSAHTDCTCPHHGTRQCDCQIVVLLVYGENEGPISLMVHSQDGRTDLSMTGTPGAGGDDVLAGKIFHTLGYQNIHSS
jgi:hypothetical protein